MIFAIPYILFVFSFFFVQYVPKSIGKTEYYFFSRVYILLSLLLFLGCRGFIVTDWVNYYPFYEQLPGLHEDGALKFIKGYPWEKGFLFLSSFIKTFSSNYFVYQFILFSVDLLIINKIIKENVNSNYYALAYISFFVFQGFVIEVNLLRNAQSILLFLLSITYIRSKSLFKYLLLNLFGILFHTTSILYIPLYFILNRKFSRKSLLLLFFLGNIIFFTRFFWISGVLKLILPLLGQSRFVSMIEAYKVLSGDANSYSIGVGFLERTVVYLFVVFYQEKIIHEDVKRLPYINLFYLFCFVYLFMSEFSILIERISLLFVAGYWIVIPSLYGCMKQNGKKIFLIVFILYSVLKLFVQCDEPFYKYSNALFQKQDYNYSYKIIDRSFK